MNYVFLHIAQYSIISVFSTPPHVLNVFTLNIPLGYNKVVLTCLTIGFPIVEWLKITENGQERILSSIRNNTLFVSAKLIFWNGLESNDAGSYVCSAKSDRYSSKTTAFTLMVSETPPLDLPPCLGNDTIPVYFQIRVLDTSCRMWQEYQKESIRIQFSRLINSLLPILCEECTFDNLVITEGPTCSSKIASAALFRGNIITNATIELTKEVFCALSSWQQLGSTIAVNNSLHQVDRTCDLRIASLEEPECPGAAGASLVAIAIGGSVTGVVFGTIAGLGFIMGIYIGR